MANEKPTNEVAAQEQPTSSTTGTETPSKPTLTKEEVMKQAINSLVQGKRHLVVKDFQSAIDSLGESCRLLSESEVQISCFENAEAHFFYGKALLEQSRLEMGVLETPDLGKSEDNTEDESEDEDKSEEEEEEDESEEAEAVAEGGGEAESSEATANGASEEVSNSNKPASTPQESAVTSTDEAKRNDVQEQEVDLNTPSPSEALVGVSGQPVDNEIPSTSSGLIADALAEKQAEEELNNLELAWEVLEVAKIGYHGLLKELTESKKAIAEKTEEEQKKLKEKEKLIKKCLADTHCSLGEVATESENYNQAIDEFKTGLDILAEIEGSDSREIAQYYFQMGLAYSFDKKYPEAIESFKKSVEIIETRISILKNNIENKQTAKDLGIELEDPSKTEADEVQELTALLPELQEKITDTIDAERESQAMEQEEQKEQEIILRNSPIKNPNPPAANDISHLVKKKKKADDAPVDERPVKKLCTEAAAPPPALSVDAEMNSDATKTTAEQGSAKSASSTNGHPIAIDV